MQIFNNLEDFKKLENAVVTIGSFDGVHIGHRLLLQKLCTTAQDTAGVSVVISFNPHPQEVLHHDPNFFTILTIEEKISLLEKENIDILLLLPFTPELANLSSEQFVEQILVEKIGTRTLIMGPGNNFGKGREGNYQSSYNFLIKNGITPILIEEYLMNDIAVRSSKIREAIIDKNYAKAEALLGHSTFRKKELQ
jgi:riboflavin kinase/FMN adenylyltransferase